MTYVFFHQQKPRPRRVHSPLTLSYVSDWLNELHEIRLRADTPIEKAREKSAMTPRTMLRRLKIEAHVSQDEIEPRAGSIYDSFRVLLEAPLPSYTTQHTRTSTCFERIEISF